MASPPSTSITQSPQENNERCTSAVIDKLSIVDYTRNTKEKESRCQEEVEEEDGVDNDAG
jgi:hypothetical protein